MIWKLLGLIAVAVAWYMAYRCAQLRAHLVFLQREVRSLGGEDQWDATCTHCGRPMRDSASVRYTTDTPIGDAGIVRTRSLFHLDRPACSAAADRVAAP